jgi:hypothetical protein
LSFSPPFFTIFYRSQGPNSIYWFSHPELSLNCDIKYKNENVKPYAKFPAQAHKQTKTVPGILIMGLDVFIPITYDCGDHKNNFFYLLKVTA